jgi:D-alanyl-lipoteichoic acid acyltransferase DltB (MBOAT superfamily)
MLFNSFEFIFFFLPISLVGFFILGRNHKFMTQQLPIFWIVAASLFFYGWWNPANLPLIIGSILFNYFIGNSLSRQQLSFSKKLLFLGIAINLGLLGYFKYFNFFLDNLNYLAGSNFNIITIALPLGISFFTFHQISYLVDAYKGEAEAYSLLKYSLFVTFFPYVISGPIVRHQEIVTQFEEESTYRFNKQTLAIGLTVFVAGLFKKVVIADSVAQFANSAFNAASQGVTLTFSEAWVGALGYTLQLYFDFSGYSDMAIGAAYMFGVRLPLNFDSPYKAVSIIDFWRRWHITLSNFLRDYLYIPLGGNRKGEIRRSLNLIITMLLGGLWHNAGWTFVIWGGLHGIYLMINHQWRSLRHSLGQDPKKDKWLIRGIGWFVTFFAVVVSWVLFRANNLHTAQLILSSMIGMNGIALPQFLESQLGFLRNWGVSFDGFTVNVGISQKYAVFGIAILLFVTWFTPNVYEWMGKYSPTLTHVSSQKDLVNKSNFWYKIQWKPNQVWSLIVATLTAISLLCFTRVSEFLYFQF